MISPVGSTRDHGIGLEGGGRGGESRLGEVCRQGAAGPGGQAEGEQQGAGGAETGREEGAAGGGEAGGHLSPPPA